MTDKPKDPEPSPEKALPLTSAAWKDHISQYWATLEARDWKRFQGLLAHHLIYELPQTRERIHGCERFIRFNAEYPGDWHIVPERTLVDGEYAVSWIRCTVAPQELDAVAFFTRDDNGLISRIVEFWPEAYEPPSGRSHLTERY